MLLAADLLLAAPELSREPCTSQDMMDSSGCVYPLVIIGAGPHSLTTLLRLLDAQPDTSVDERTRGVTPSAQLQQRTAKQKCNQSYRCFLKVTALLHLVHSV
jgi:hypothetical protein